MLLCVLQGMAQIHDGVATQQAAAGSPLGIPDGLGSYITEGVDTASAAPSGVPNFLVLAQYAWSGKAPTGTIIPASAHTAASSGNTYEASVNRALDVLVLLFPEESANINNNRAALVAHIASGRKMAPSSLRNASDTQGASRRGWNDSHIGAQHQAGVSNTVWC